MLGVSKTPSGGAAPASIPPSPPASTRGGSEPDGGGVVMKKHSTCRDCRAGPAAVNSRRGAIGLRMIAQEPAPQAAG